MAQVQADERGIQVQAGRITGNVVQAQECDASDHRRNLHRRTEKGQKHRLAGQLAAHDGQRRGNAQQASAQRHRQRQAQRQAK